MNVGDTVAHTNLVGTIVGVSSSGNPIVEWADNDFTEESAEELIVVELPVPNDELNPESDGVEEAERLAKKRQDQVESLQDAVNKARANTDGE